MCFNHVIIISFKKCLKPVYLRLKSFDFPLSQTGVTLGKYQISLGERILEYIIACLAYSQISDCIWKTRVAFSFLFPHFKSTFYELLSLFIPHLLHLEKKKKTDIVWNVNYFLKKFINDLSCNVRVFESMEFFVVNYNFV